MLADNVAEHRRIFTPAFAGRYVAQHVEVTLNARFREVNLWAQSNLNLAGHFDNVPFFWPRRIIGLPMPSDESRSYPLPVVASAFDTINLEDRGGFDARRFPDRQFRSARLRLLAVGDFAFTTFNGPQKGSHGKRADLSGHQGAIDQAAFGQRLRAAARCRIRAKDRPRRGALLASSTQRVSRDVVQLQPRSICQCAVGRQLTHGVPGFHEARGVALISGRFTLGAQKPPVSK